MGELPVHWARSGNWILYMGPEGLSLISPDGANQRTLSSRRFDTFGFSKAEDVVYAVLHDGEAGGWRLFSVAVATGAETLLAKLDLPASTDSVSGFSLHPDGRRFAMSVVVRPRDIWMLEGFDQSRDTRWSAWLNNHQGRAGKRGSVP